jgi:hypothetical protein
MQIIAVNRRFGALFDRRTVYGVISALLIRQCVAPLISDNMQQETILFLLRSRVIRLPSVISAISAMRILEIKLRDISFASNRKKNLISMHRAIYRL